MLEATHHIPQETSGNILVTDAGLLTYSFFRTEPSIIGDVSLKQIPTGHYTGLSQMVIEFSMSNISPYRKLHIHQKSHLYGPKGINMDQYIFKVEVFDPICPIMSIELDIDGKYALYSFAQSGQYINSRKLPRTQFEVIEFFNRAYEDSEQLIAMAAQDARYQRSLGGTS